MCGKNWWENKEEEEPEDQGGGRCLGYRAGITLMGVEGPQKRGLFHLHTGTQIGLGLRRGKAGLSPV